MGTFAEDFWTNCKNDLAGNTSVPSTIGNGYAAYVSFTNVAVGGSYVGKLVQLGRTVEATAVSFATGGTSANWAGELR